MIVYKDTRRFTANQLERLFLSVNWESGKYPKKIVKAMHGYDTVFSAWENDELVGLVCAMDDGIMTAYVHFLLVDPSCQGMGIGHELISRIKEHYKDYMSIVLIAYKDKTGFYGKCGFDLDDSAVPMHITKL
ncbi:GNAT family N-acetyltransferase [Ruminococcus albus]|uniref:Acetyltransferase (GNAT) domain-containing protein n=1 Tax=Ruminococcus albus TaxID=1264 RepID=A0A1I1NH35_RUMAL|nr:GNAT family N-acetyltransferase [Ruminococcus albus]SFC94798.1 Acetyltransferase (GNAT) domain-containing protein [Ruminococcus albus]